MTEFEGQYVVTQEERTMAMLAHVLQLVGWWIAPLIIFLIGRRSRFVSFHALQALLLQIAQMLAFGILMIGCFVFFLSTAFQESNTSSGSPPTVVVFFPLLFLIFIAMWVLMLVFAIMCAIKAGRGEWAEYPLLGPVARRFLKIGPGGSETVPPSLTGVAS